MDRAKGLFVVKTDDRAVKLALLKKFECEDIAEDAVVVTAGKGGVEGIRKVVGASVPVMPVLVDESGNLLYPTGGLAVRFDKAPSDSALQKFAKAQGLKIVKRNDYVPSQVAFEPMRGADPVELVDSLSSADGVKQAWPETRSQYRKA